MTITTHLTTYKTDGVEKFDTEGLKVESHWNRDNMVRLTVGKQTLTVLAHDLKSAVDRCARWR